MEWRNDLSNRHKSFKIDFESLYRPTEASYYLCMNYIWFNLVRENLPEVPSFTQRVVSITSPTLRPRKTLLVSLLESVSISFRNSFSAASTSIFATKTALSACRELRITILISFQSSYFQHVRNYPKTTLKFAASWNVLENLFQKRGH